VASVHDLVVAEERPVPMTTITIAVDVEEEDDPPNNGGMEELP